jgi:glutamate racemase
VGAPHTDSIATPGQPSTIGLFDSGVGGLSILRHVRAALPAENLVYFSDAGFAPYGDKSDAWIVERSLAIADYLVTRRAKAIVVACNTATAIAVDAVRTRYPSIIVVGVEPGLKPAAQVTATRIVGVLATAATLASQRFAQLQQQISAACSVQFILQACPGLADQIEKGELCSAATAALVSSFIQPLIAQGADTIVLGCTHYAFAQPLIITTISQIQAGTLDTPHAPVTLIDTGSAVARQLVALLRSRNQLQDQSKVGSLTACSTGNADQLSDAFKRLLDLSIPVTSDNRVRQ